MGKHLTRWLIPLPAIALSFFSTTAQAEPIAGLNAVGYSVSAIPPTRSDDIYPVCHSEIENNINRNFEGERFGSCPVDMFMVHYTGFITIPANNTIKFMVAADDGGTVKIGLTEFGTWNDKGCSWSAQTTEPFEAGSYPLDGWFYEHSGGTCYMLAWNINNTGWAIVPDEAFTTNVVSTTTITTVQETTTSWVPSTTSTTMVTTSTTIVETTTVPATTTTVIPSTTTTTTTEPVQTSTTTSTTSTTVVPTTTTEVPYTPPQTSTAPSPTTEPQPEETTPEPETTIDEPETSTTVPDETLPEPVEPDETTIPETTVPYPEVEPAPDETEQPTNTTEPQEYTTETTLIEETDSSPTTLPETVIEIPADKPVTNEQLEKILDTLTEAAPEQIVAAITQVLAADITSDQATQIASSPEVLAAITETQAEQLFEKIEVEELTEEQLEAFTEAIQQAPTKIKKAFEKTINIFGSQFENYVPTGSNIPVKTRRTLVAAGALIAAIPSTRMRR